MEEMGLKGCETCCQVSCEGSVSRGLPYRIPGLFEIFFILLFPGRARRGRLKKKSSENPVVSWSCGSSVFGKSPKQLEKFAPVQGTQNLGCCRVVGGLHCEAEGPDVSSEDWWLVSVCCDICGALIFSFFFFLLKSTLSTRFGFCRFLRHIHVREV